MGTYDPTPTARTLTVGSSGLNSYTIQVWDCNGTEHTASYTSSTKVTSTFTVYGDIATIYFPYAYSSGSGYDVEVTGGTLLQKCIAAASSYRWYLVVIRFTSSTANVQWGPY